MPRISVSSVSSHAIFQCAVQEEPDTALRSAADVIFYGETWPLMFKFIAWDVRMQPARFNAVSGFEVCTELRYKKGGWVIKVLLGGCKVGSNRYTLLLPYF